MHNHLLTLWAPLFSLVNAVSLDVPDADKTEAVATKQTRVLAVFLQCRNCRIGNFRLQLEKLKHHKKYKLDKPDELHKLNKKLSYPQRQREGERERARART